MEEPDPGKSPIPEAVFQSVGGSITNATEHKKEARRSIGERLKMRRSTPRPTMKGVGNKRFITTPSPSAKPKFKRAAAKEEEEETSTISIHKKNLMAELDRVAETDGKGTVVGEDGTLGKRSSTDGVCAEKEITIAGSSAQTPGQGSGDGMKNDGEGGDKPSHASKIPFAGPREGQTPLVSEKVNLPEMEKETKPLSESSLATSSSGPSRDLGAVGNLMQPKKNSNMQLAHDTTPASVPSLVQLAGDDTADEGVVASKHTSFPRMAEACEVQPPSDGEKVNLAEMEIETNVISERSLVPCQLGDARDTLGMEATMQPNMDNLIQIVSMDSAERLDSMMAQPLLEVGLPEEGIMAGGARFALPMVTKPIRAILPNPQGPSLEDFPPLERGRIRKLRNSFEAGPWGGGGLDERQNG